MLRTISSRLFLATLAIVLSISALHSQIARAENPQQRQADMALLKQYMGLMDRADTAEYKKIEDRNLIRGFTELMDMADEAHPNTPDAPPAPTAARDPHQREMTPAEKLEDQKRAKKRQQDRDRLNKLDDLVPPESKNLHDAVKAVLAAVHDEEDQKIEMDRRTRGVPVPEPSPGQKRYREEIKPELTKRFGQVINRILPVVQKKADDLLDVYEGHVTGSPSPALLTLPFDNDISTLLSDPDFIKLRNDPDILKKLGDIFTSISSRPVNTTTPQNPPLKLSSRPTQPTAPYNTPSRDSASTPDGIFRAGPQPWGHSPHNQTTVLAYEAPKKAEQESPKRQPTLADYIQAAAELHTVDNEEFVDELIDQEIKLIHQAAAEARLAREQEMIMVNEWVIRQETVWNEIQPQLIANRIPPARQWAILTKVVYARPEYYGPRIFIDSLNPTLVVNQLPPAPVTEVAVEGGDVANTAATNAVLEAGVAKFQQTQVHRYEVSAPAPTVAYHSNTEVVAAPTVVHEGSVAVAAEPVVHAGPSVSVVTRRPRPVRTVARATAVTAAVAAETVVPRRRVVRRRPVVEAGARVVAAPVVTVARARPVVRVRQVVRRPVVRARRVVGRRGLR